MTWWNNTPSNWTPEEGREARSAYWHTFMGAEEGRKVLAHLCWTSMTTEGGKPVDERLSRIDFVEWIRQQCGPQDDLARIEAEAKAAAKGLLEPTAESRRKEFDGYSQSSGK